MADTGPPPADAPGIHLARLQAYLMDYVPELRVDEPLDVALLAGGRSNVSYRLSQGSQSWVLRRPPLGHVMPTAHDMSREHRVLSGLSRVGFPVPMPVLLCDDASVIGAPFLVMEFVPGRVIASAEDAASVPPGSADSISAAFVETLAGLHSVDATTARLEGLGRPEGYLQRQVRRWLGQWERTKTREHDGVGRLGSWLEEGVDALPTGMRWSIVHGDYRLDNLILDADGTGVGAVLDWEMSTLGDPVADLAVALVYWSRPGEPLRHRIPVATGVTDGPGFWNREDLASAYANTSGGDLGHLDLCLGLACLKLAVIMESIHYRTVRGQQLGAAATDGVDMAAAADALLDLGLAVRAGGGVQALAG